MTLGCSIPWKPKEDLSGLWEVLNIEGHERRGGEPEGIEAGDP